MIINQGFKRKRDESDRLPPGQYESKDFPVLSLGPTPIVTENDWSLKIFGLIDPVNLNFAEFKKLPSEEIKTNIHCVTKWSKFDTKWRGVSFDTIIKKFNLKNNANFLIAYSYDGYTTNIPLADISGGKAWVVFEYDGKPIPKEHGGPVRLLIPHLYFWKSAKWVRALEFVDHDEPGFWETRGYHNYGDPWKEQRYSFDE